MSEVEKTYLISWRPFVGHLCCLSGARLVGQAASAYLGTAG